MSDRQPNIGRAIRAAVRLAMKHTEFIPPVDVERVARALDVSVHYEALEQNISGVLVRRGSHTSIAVNSIHAVTRQRFTIAHELGHLSLHQKSPGVFVDDALVYFRDERSARATDPLEVEANVFAANLLMPKALLERDLKGRYIDAFDDVSVRALALRYTVSQQALTIRLTQLGFLEGVPQING